VSYANQGTFSFAFWPFSFKLLWAPIVDSVYVKKIGRRKSKTDLKLTYLHDFSINNYLRLVGADAIFNWCIFDIIFKSCSQFNRTA
jgi:hypothetical protein